MAEKSAQPYQPLLLRILHGVTGVCVIAATLTAYWTYDTYDGRWGGLSLPKLQEIEGIHGTFGLFALLVFPLFALYAFHRGQRKLIQPDSLAALSQTNTPAWWYTLHRFANTLIILALTFALFSGKMMDETWLPKGELNHLWYLVHLIAWVVLVSSLALHLLMSAKVGGVPLLWSMLHWRFRTQDSPILWRSHLQQWWQGFCSTLIKEWSQLSLPLKFLEEIVLISLISAWIISLFK